MTPVWQRPPPHSMPLVAGSDMKRHRALQYENSMHVSTRTWPLPRILGDTPIQDYSAWCLHYSCVPTFGVDPTYGSGYSHVHHRVQATRACGPVPR